MSRPDPHTMTRGDAARVLGISADYVPELDDTLKPRRTATGQRRYDPRRVYALAKVREAKRQAR